MLKISGSIIVLANGAVNASIRAEEIDELIHSTTSSMISDFADILVRVAILALGKFRFHFDSKAH